VINDPTAASRRRRRAVIPITVGVALCLVTLGVWLTFAVRGDDGRGEHAREIELEVTSEAGQVKGIVWRYPDDGNKIHDVSDSSQGMIKTPWSRRIDVKSAKGPIILNVIHDPDSTGATCRILVNGKVTEEQSGVFPHCMTTAQRAFPTS
jgi:hypothetical protein